MLGGYDAPPCKSIRFGVTDASGALESENLSRSYRNEVSGSVEESDFAIGGFSTSEAIAKRRADDRDGGSYEFSSGDDIFRIPPVESTVEHEGVKGGEEQVLSQTVPKEFVE